MAGFSPHRVSGFSSQRNGFTLIELLIASVIFTLTVGALIAIFVVVTRVQVRQSGAAEVNQQAQFLQTQIQYYIQNARIVDMTGDSAAGTLKLRESDLTKDPTYIYVNNVISFVQSTSSYDDVGHNDGTSTFVSALTAGNTVIVAIDSDAFACYGISISDSLGNAYSLAVSSTLQSSEGEMSIYYAKNIIGGADSVHWHDTCGSRVAFALYEYSGLDKTSPLDMYNASSVQAGTAINTGSSTTNSANELLFSVGYDFTNNSTSSLWTVSSGWTKHEALQGSAGHESALSTDQIVSSVGTYSNTFGGFPSGDHRGAQIATFKAANQTCSIGSVCLKQTDSGTPTPLTSSKVKVSNLSFTRHYQIASSTAIGNETVSYSFTMSANAGGLGNNYSQTVQGSAQVLGPVPQIALIQKAMAENNNTNISSISSTYSGSNSSGNLLLAVVSTQGGAATTTVTDTLGNTWNKISAGLTNNIAFVQSTSSAVSASKGTSTFPSAVTAGNLIIASVEAADSSNCYNLSVTDSLGNAYSLAVSSTVLGSGGALGIYYAKNITGGTDSVHWDDSVCNGGRGLFAINEYSGLDTASPFDAKNASSSPGAAGTTINTGSSTTSNANELLFSLGYDFTTNSTSSQWTVSSGWTKREAPQGSAAGQESALTADEVVSSTGTYSNTFGGFPNGDSRGAQIATFKGVLSNTVNVFAAANAKTGANTVTAAFTGGTPNYGSMFLYEYRGANTTLSVDASSSQTQVSTTTPSSGFASPTGNVELLIGVSAYNSLIDTWTPGALYAMESSSTVSATLAEDRVLYFTSPADAAWTINNARTTLDLIVGVH